MLVQKNFFKAFTINLLLGLMGAILTEFFIFHAAMAKPIETSPHIFVDEVDNSDWFFGR